MINIISIASFNEASAAASVLPEVTDEVPTFFGGTRLPACVDLRTGATSIEPLGSCTFNALHSVAIYDLAERPSLNAIKLLLSLGFSFSIGIDFYESFKSEKVAKSGMVALPADGEKFLGGITVRAFGYDDTKKMLLIESLTFYKQGFFDLPYAYFEKGFLHPIKELDLVAVTKWNPCRTRLQKYYD